MVIRKVLLFKTILGFTIPKEYAKALDLERGDYVQVHLGKNKCLIVLKRNDDFTKITERHAQVAEGEESINV